MARAEGRDKVRAEHSCAARSSQPATRRAASTPPGGSPFFPGFLDALGELRPAARPRKSLLPNGQMAWQNPMRPALPSQGWRDLAPILPFSPARSSSWRRGSRRSKRPSSLGDVLRRRPSTERSEHRKRRGGTLRSPNRHHRERRRRGRARRHGRLVMRRDGGRCSQSSRRTARPSKGRPRPAISGSTG